MEKQNPVNWFQVLALCSALGLGGACVWSRQKQAAPRPVSPPVSVVTTETKDEQPAPEPVKVDTQRLVLSGSKSGILMPPPSSDHDEDEEKPKEPRVLMPSSKVGLFKPGPEKKEERILMPGSKSAIVIPQERILLPSSKSITMPVFRERHPAPADQPKPAEP